jgi:hypothetical protein
MNKRDVFEALSSQEQDEPEGFYIPIPIDVGVPILRASGLYQWYQYVPLPNRPPREPWPADTVREELRLDVDGHYPLMVASGTRFFALSSVVHWIADVTPTLVVRGRAWRGTIWYKHGNLVH